MVELSKVPLSAYIGIEKEYHKYGTDNTIKKISTGR